MFPTLLLLGHFPPPRGGVAVHLDRLRDALRNRSFAVRCISFGTRDPAHPDTLLTRRQPLAFLGALLRGAPLLHYHTDEADWKAAALLGLWCALRRQTYVLTLHSFRRHSFLEGSLSRRVVAFVYRRAARIICISENLQREVSELLPEASARTVVITSYLPPSDAERNTPPPARFDELTREHDTVICFNAYAPTLYQGRDLYGGDVVLDAFALVQQEFPTVGLAMVYVRLDDSSNAQTIRAKARALGARVALIENHVGPFIPVLERSAILVRATLNDGGPSLSVLEALSLGVWCAASDAVPRPRECELFRTRDPEDLARALRLLLHRVSQGERQPPVRFPDAVDDLIPLYQSLTTKS